MSYRFLRLAASLCLLTAGCGAPEDEKGAKTTESGLKYIDQAEGAGEPAKTGDVVEVQYTGTLRADGSKFDSSYDRGAKPFKFTLGQGQVIKGWDEGIVGMKPGGKRKLIIPANLAYGERSPSDKIPANSDLVFEVELVRIVPGVPRLTKLLIEELKKGDGDAVKNGDRVEVYYAGRLKSNGKQFDSNVGSNKPFEVPVGAGKVIAGWDQGLIGMKVGGKYRLSIPAKLGYGARGAGEDIPPDSDLEFEIEVVRIK